MKTVDSILCILLIFLFSCSSNPEKAKKQDKEYVTIENLDISKNWIEIPDRNEPGPTREMKDLRTVHITKVDTINAVVFNYRNESKCFKIKSIEKMKDSILFITALPLDTTETMNISIKFLDPDRFIARWIIDNTIFNYFPYKDTLGNNRVLIEDDHR